MKKKFTVLFLAFTMIFTMLAFTACGGGDSADSGDGDAAAETSYGEGYVFKHGFDLDYRPYSYIDDNGENGGFDVEMAKAVCEYYGWEYEAVPFNWDAKDAELNAGSCDCIWSGFTVEGRENDYCWSEPYSVNSQMILVADDSGIKTLDDLAGKVVGVQTATSAYTLLTEDRADLADTFASLEVYETYPIAFQDLKAGGIDAIAVDATLGSFLISDETGYSFLEESLGDETYAIGFRIGEDALRDQVNEALKALWADGTIAKILENEDYAEIADYISLG